MLLSDGTRLPADIVLIGVGAEANVEWLEASGLAVPGAVPVDASMRTSDPDVFAAGDVALVKDPRCDKAHRFEHWTSAQRQGYHAGLAMLGRTEAYREVPFFWSRQCGKSIKYAGFAGAAWDRIVYRGDPAGDSFLGACFAGPRLVGAASFAMSWNLIAVEKLLREGGTLSPEQVADERQSLTALAGLTSGEE